MTETTHPTSRWSYSGRMRAAVITLATVAALGGGMTIAQTVDAAPKCKALGSEQTVESRVTMGGVVQRRTVTVTKQRCRGKVSSSVTYSVWA